jgi:nickel/cobalt exporter
MESFTLTSVMALAFGVFHALEPGHGKTALLTYLASGKRTWLDGLVIALSSVVTHSLAVFMIAFLSHFVFHHASHESKVDVIGEMLSLASGGLIVALGAWMIWKAQKGEPPKPCSTCNSHHRSGEHKHENDNQDHSSQGASRFYTAGLLGVATGLIPCPSVVVAYLSGVSTGNSFLGLQNVLLFAVGMSLSLMALVVFFSLGSEGIRERLRPRTSKVRWINWNTAQGFVFVGIGLFTALYHWWELLWTSQ